jgi:crotonobetainyl-CoA:carnitine CoA-transferase CaiB-like acyl-CoA transferase
VEETAAAWAEQRAVSAAAPLAGIRVIDVGTRVAAPYCAGILGELGAEVIKLEDPRGGDVLRGIGPFDGDTSLFFAVEGRNRRSVTCNLRDHRGQELARRLIATADVLCENFRPGTLERWGLGPADLPAHLVVVRVSVLGQSGPDSDRPGLDLTAIAMGGLLALTGDPGGPPVKSGVTVADHLTASFAAEAALAALLASRTTGRGTVIDVPLHASVLRCLEWTIAAYDRTGTVRRRAGMRGPHRSPSGVYAAEDGRYVAVVVDDDDVLRRLWLLLDAQPGSDSEAAVARWIGAGLATEAVAALVRAGVPAALVAAAADLVADEHLGARGDLVEVVDPVRGPVVQQAPFPRLVTGPATAPMPAPALGADNYDVWCGEIGLGAEELEDYRVQGVI